MSRSLTWVLLMVPATLSGQTISAAGVVYGVQHRVLFEGAVADQTGVWFGGEGSVQVGRFELLLRGLQGRLGGATDPAVPDLSIRSSMAAARIEAAPWAQLGAEVEAMRFQSDAGATTWRLIGVGAALTPAIGGPGIRGFMGGTFYPAAAVVGDSLRMAPAFRLTLGITYARQQSPILVNVGYRFDRLDFTNGRLEQFRGAVASIGIRLGHDHLAAAATPR